MTDRILGLFSKAVWYFENHAWSAITGGDASETGSGAGSYNIKNSVWHVNCCNPELNGGGGWGIFNALFGWTNSATYGSVLSYNLYWLAVIVVFISMRFKEQKGHWPLMKAKATDAQADTDDDQTSESDVNSEKGAVVDESAVNKRADAGRAPTTAVVREMEV